MAGGPPPTGWPRPSWRGASLEPVLAWLTQNLASPLDAAAIARRAGLSTRSLSRHFQEQVGTTPAKWVLHARVRRAQELLEKTAHSIEQIADGAGFGSGAAFREQFRRQVGTSPLLYRAAFRAASLRRAPS